MFFLSRCLLTQDSVSFYSLVKTQRRGERVRQGSGWQLLPAAEILFTMSARRVFAAPSAPPDPEPSPKWLALAEVVAEIHRAIHSGQEVSDTVEEQMETIFEMAEGAKKDPGTILILTRDDRTCTQLNTVCICVLSYTM